MTTLHEAARAVERLQAERKIHCQVHNLDAEIERLRALASAPRVPQSARFLFLAMDDDGVAHATYCTNEAEVEAAVCAAMFWLEQGKHLDPEHQEQLRGIVATLLEDGTMRFEGDAPLHLFKLAAAPQPEGGA